MSARILDGAALARTLRAEVAAEVRTLARQKVVPRLEVILIGDDAASRVYVGAKGKACAEAGIRSTTHSLAATAEAADLAALIGRLNGDDDVDGILVQLPLPAPLDPRAVLDRIDPAKDVDGFHPFNVGLLHQGRPSFVPCTPAGVMVLLEREGIALAGAHTVVVGRSEIVGKPMAALLLARHATVTICHSRTRELAAVCRQADVLVTAVGKAGFIDASCIKSGAVVIDVGINRVDDPALLARLFRGDAGRSAQFAKRGYVLTGDVDFASASEVAAAITPVPGGIGPLTIAALLANTVHAARRRRGLD